MDQVRERQLLEKFGESFRKAREAKGLSLRDLGDIADMDYNNISDIERGLVRPTIITFISLAEALDLDPAKLLSFAR